MLKLFRKIRYDLMEKNKTGKYLKYAIGEIVLVVIGILIAVSINTWNEGRKLETKRQILIASLIEDFEYNIDDLIDVNLKLVANQLATMDTFYKHIHNDTQLIPVDSLKILARRFFTYETYSPKLTTYKEAESTGSISLLQNKDLSLELTLFMNSYEMIKALEEQNRYTYFNGASWEFRKTVEPGTIYNSVYSGSTAKDISFSEYVAVMSTPLAQNALQNGYILSGNFQYGLNLSHKNTTNILRLLKEMQTE